MEGTVETLTEIYNTLTNDSTLMGLVTGVYTDVPQSTGYPYLVLELGPAADESTMGLDGIELTLDVHVWSTSDSPLEGLNILKEVKRLLHKASISLSNPYSNAGVYYTSGIGVRKDPDGETYHGVESYKTIVFGS